MANLIREIASDTILDQAYEWLCKRRENLSHNNDVWELRRSWKQIKPELQQEILQGEYRFNSLVELRLPDGNLECWCAVDSLVMKALAIVLGKHLKPVIAPTCVHVQGLGGAKKAVRDVFHALKPGSHVMKSDVRSYYASIDHMLMFNAMSACITDKYVLRLLWQYLKRTVRYGENYREVKRGISLGCPLSPLMAALYLKPLDDVIEGSRLFYVRYVDDWIVIAPTRWKLRRAVRRVNEVLETLKVEQHPLKTFIGKAGRGFNFLGYHFGPNGLSIAKDTFERFIDRATRLYEQEREKHCSSSRLGLYVRRWMRWVTYGGISPINVSLEVGSCLWIPEALSNIFYGTLNQALRYVTQATLDGVYGFHAHL